MLHEAGFEDFDDFMESVNAETRRNNYDDDDDDEDTDESEIDTGWVNITMTENDDDELVSTIYYISGQVKQFDIEMFRRVASMYLLSEDEYERMGVGDSRQTCLTTFAYLATLAFEFSNDNFMPDYVVYENMSTEYEFHGKIDERNIGNCIVVFTAADGSSVYLDGIMCGDNIVWEFDFNDPTTFSIGHDADSLTDYPAAGFPNAANYMASLIDPEL